MYATWGVPAHSAAAAAVVVVFVVAAAAAELVPLAGLLAARRSVLGLLLVLVLARELGPEPEPALGCDVAARRTFAVVPVPAPLPMFDVHRLSDFDLELAPVPSVCKIAPYWASQKLVVVGLSFVEGMRGEVAGFGVGAEAALGEAGQRAGRADAENCWAPYFQRLPSRAKRAKAQHGETRLRH